MKYPISKIPDHNEQLIKHFKRLNVRSGVQFSFVFCLLILSGCGEAGKVASNSTDITTTETTTTPTPTITVTPTTTPHPPSEWSRERKYRYFAERYSATLQEVRVQVHNISIDNGSGEMRLTYKMKSPQNSSVKRNETAHILTGYASLTTAYQNESNDEVNISWIPRRLNVTALDPETGAVYWRGHTNYTVMNRYRTGEDSYAEYFLTYVETLERGPAHPEYAGS